MATIKNGRHSLIPRYCPSCEGSRDLSLIEEHRDPIGGISYQITRCGNCGLSFSDPRDPVGPSWYEKSAPLRGKESRSRAASDWRFLKFLSSGIKPGRILDVGCGDGGFLKMATDKGWKGVGVDYEERMIKIARSFGVEAHSDDYNSFLKKRAAKEFDVVTLFDVLEHIPEPRSLIEQIKPVLKRGGYLVVTFPNDSRPALFPREEYDYPPHHFTRWNLAALRSFLRREGFKIETLVTVGPSIRWFSENLFFVLIAPIGIKLFRLIMFGRNAQGTLTDLMSEKNKTNESLLSDKSRRQHLVDNVKYACRLITYPMGLILSLLWRLRPQSGEYIYCLARYEN